MQLNLNIVLFHEVNNFSLAFVRNKYPDNAGAFDMHTDNLKKKPEKFTYFFF
jgi:hypothetical protein